MNVAMLRVLIAAVLVLWPALALGQSFPRKYDSAASTNATLVAGGYAQVRVIAVTNTVATVYYLKLYDKSTAPVCGTDVVVYKTALPASTAFVVPISRRLGVPERAWVLHHRGDCRQRHHGGRHRHHRQFWGQTMNGVIPNPVGVKLAQITPAAAPPAPTDSLVGLQGGSNDVLYSVTQLGSVFGGGGGGVPIAPVASVSPENARLVKPGAGVVIGLYAVNLSTVDGFLLLLDATAVPADGPVTPIGALPLPGYSVASLAPDAPIACANGIVVVLSSASSPFNKITSAGLTGYISCQAQ